MSGSALKFDGGKPGFELLPADALGAINEVLRFGAAKYRARNWELGFDWTRLANAAQRHIFAWAQGEDADPESGRSHLEHAGCMILFAIAHEMRGLGTDDRARPLLAPEPKDTPNA